MTVKDPTIVVDINGELIIFIGTPENFVLQSENADYASEAEANMERIREVPLIHGMPYKLFPTGKDTFLEITAAIVAINPGHAVIAEAPEEVLAELLRVRGPFNPDVVY